MFLVDKKLILVAACMILGKVALVCLVLYGLCRLAC